MGQCLEDFPGVPAHHCGQRLEMWVRLAGSNVIFNWNYLFCRVDVEGGDAWNEKKIHQVAGKKILNEGGERGRKEKLLNSRVLQWFHVSAALSLSVSSSTSIRAFIQGSQRSSEQQLNLSWLPLPQLGPRGFSLQPEPFSQRDERGNSCIPDPLESPHGAQTNLRATHSSNAHPGRSGLATWRWV